MEQLKRGQLRIPGVGIVTVGEEFYALDDAGKAQTVDDIIADHAQRVASGQIKPPAETPEPEGENPHIGKFGELVRRAVGQVSPVPGAIINYGSGDVIARNDKIAAQAVGNGVADTVGMVADGMGWAQRKKAQALDAIPIVRDIRKGTYDVTQRLVNGASESVGLGQLMNPVPPSYDPADPNDPNSKPANKPFQPSDVLGGEAIKDTFSEFASSLGYEGVDRKDMSSLEKLASNTTEFATEAFIPGLGLVGLAKKIGIAQPTAAELITEAASKVPASKRFVNNLLRPYASNPQKALAAEVGGGIGFGHAVDAAEEAGLPWWAQIPLGLVGGTAGSVASGAPGAVKNKVADLLDPTERQISSMSNRDLRLLRQKLAHKTLDPEDMRQNLDRTISAVRETGAPMPYSGGATNDPYQMTREMEYRTRNPDTMTDAQNKDYRAKDMAIQAMRGMHDPSADPMAISREADNIRDYLVGTAKRKEGELDQRITGVTQDMTRRAEGINAIDGNRASREFGKAAIADTQAATARKNASMESLKTSDPVDISPLREFAKNEIATVNILKDMRKELPEDVFRILAVKDPKSAKAGPVVSGAGGGSKGPRPVTQKDVMELNASLGEYAQAASRQGYVNKANAIRRLHGAVFDVVKRFDKDGVFKGFEEEYAPFYRNQDLVQDLQEDIVAHAYGGGKMPDSEKILPNMYGTEDRVKNLTTIRSQASNPDAMAKNVEDFFTKDASDKAIITDTVKVGGRDITYKRHDAEAVRDYMRENDSLFAANPDLRQSFEAGIAKQANTDARTVQRMADAQHRVKQIIQQKEAEFSGMQASSFTTDAVTGPDGVRGRIHTIMRSKDDNVERIKLLKDEVRKSPEAAKAIEQSIVDNISKDLGINVAKDASENATDARAGILRLTEYEDLAAATLPKEQADAVRLWARVMWAQRNVLKSKPAAPGSQTKPLQSIANHMRTITYSLTGDPFRAGSNSKLTTVILNETPIGRFLGSKTTSGRLIRLEEATTKSPELLRAVMEGVDPKLADEILEMSPQHFNQKIGSAFAIQESGKEDEQDEQDELDRLIQEMAR